MAGGIYLTDTRQNEDKPDRNGATVKSTAFSTCFVLDQGLDDTNKQTTSQGTGTNEFLINIIDSPGGLDLPAAVTTALRVTDGSIVVVDSIDGIGTQTMTALRIALVERIKPVLVINKNDRAILELQLPKEELYKVSKLACVIHLISLSLMHACSFCIVYRLLHALSIPSMRLSQLIQVTRTTL